MNTHIRLSSHICVCVCICICIWPRVWSSLWQTGYEYISRSLGEPGDMWPPSLNPQLLIFALLLFHIWDFTFPLYCIFVSVLFNCIYRFRPEQLDRNAIPETQFLSKSRYRILTGPTKDLPGRSMDLIIWYHKPQFFLTVYKFLLKFLWFLFLIMGRPTRRSSTRYQNIKVHCPITFQQLEPHVCGLFRSHTCTHYVYTYTYMLPFIRLRTWWRAWWPYSWPEIPPAVTRMTQSLTDSSLNSPSGE